VSSIWDLGLQPERTELAWRRTALSLAVVSLVAARLLPAVLDSWLWAVPGVIGVVTSGVIWWVARRRYRSTVDALHRYAVDQLPDGRLLLLIATLVTLLGLTGLSLAALSVR
jgi:uncharacterized membrane protein YidH (DUF202 family)